MAELFSDLDESKSISYLDRLFLAKQIIASSLWFLRNQVLFVFIFIIIHILFSQFLDVYRSEIDSIDSELILNTPFVSRFFITFLSVLVFCSLLFFTGLAQIFARNKHLVHKFRNFLAKKKPDSAYAFLLFALTRSREEVQSRRILNLKWITILLIAVSLIPFATFIFAPFFDWIVGALRAGKVDAHIVYALLINGFVNAALFLSISCGILFLPVFRVNYFFLNGKLLGIRFSRFDAFSLSTLAIFILILLTLLMTKLDMLTFTFIGPIGLIGFGFSFFLIIGYFFIRAEYLVGLPILPLIIIYCTLISLAGWTDNHKIETNNINYTPAPVHSGFCNMTDEPMPVKVGFKAWSSNLKLKTEKKLGPLPVILICLEGGGIYAAAHSAILLDKITRTIDGFKDHIFLISGASGGSVGAVAYVSSLQSNYQAQNVKNLFKTDFLSPVMGSLFFFDFLQVFIPFPICAFDRAKALEYTIEKTALCKEFSKGSIFNYWYQNQNLPFLALNATNAINGERVVISPLGFPNSEYDRKKFDALPDGSNLPLCGVPPFKNLKNIIREEDCKISTAAFISARFPVVTPPGTFRSQEGTYKLIDGGYYENSGGATLYDFLTEIIYNHSPRKFSTALTQRQPRTQCCFPDQFKFCVIRIGTTPDFDQKKAPFYTGEISTPIFGLYNTRIERQYESLNHIRYLLDDYNRSGLEPETSSNSIFIRFRFDPIENQTPLGWVLSKRSLDKIVYEVECNPDTKKAIDALAVFLNPN